MQLSIKKKFYLIFIIMLLISELVILGLSDIFLDDIVISANKVLIKKVYDEYSPYFELEDINIKTLNNITNKNDIGIVIYENGEIDSCRSLFLCEEDEPSLPTYISNYLPYIKENEYKSRIIDLELIDVYQLVNIYNLGDGKYIVINKSLHSVHEINRIVIGFVQISGIIVFLLGSIIIFITSNKLTKPIIKISDYAKDLANLNFNNELEVVNHDEIGQLALNMNLISKKLSVALNDLNKANKKLRDDLETEKELDRKRVKFFSSVSHEFKTPLTIIQGYAEGIKHNIVKSKDGIDEYCDVIIDESKNMSYFINDLLNLSLYETDNFVLKKVEFDIVILIKKVVNKFQDYVQSIKANINIISCEKCIINADKNRIEQVITNLLTNALKFIEENGIVRITVQKYDSRVKIYFFNDGQNINEKEIKNIWSLFYKLDNGKNQMGTGIGLSIVKSIIELHNGSYGVKNKSDGVEFYIDIPQ